MSVDATDDRAQAALRGLRVADVMLRAPRLLPAGATLGEARRMLGDDHVHLVLLVEDGDLVGTLDRTDVAGGQPDGDAALGLATLRDRTIDADADALAARDDLVERGVRRRAVIDADGRLLGLLCLKRSGAGFCSDRDVRERSADRPVWPASPRRLPTSAPVTEGATMPTVERTITVPKPLSTVWDYVSDFTNAEEWDPPTKSCTREVSAGTDGRGVGTEYLNVSTVAGTDTEIRYTVTEFEPQQRMQMRGEMSSMKLLDTITFTGDETTTTLTYHAEFEPQGAAKLIEPVLPLGLKRLGDKTADSLEERLQQLPG